MFYLHNFYFEENFFISRYGNYTMITWLLVHNWTWNFIEVKRIAANPQVTGTGSQNINVVFSSNHERIYIQQNSERINSVVIVGAGGGQAGCGGWWNKLKLKI